LLNIQGCSFLTVEQEMESNTIDLVGVSLDNEWRY
jgi:hypothetical protein